MTKKAFVLLSGGIDSTTCLYMAMRDFQDVEAISVDYGQRHAKEFEYAAETCRRLDIEHSVLNVAGILSGEGVMLTDASVKIPNMSYDEIKGVSPTYVPFRNGTMLSLITAHAQKWVNKKVLALIAAPGSSQDPQHCLELMKDSVGIYFGAHAEDAAGWAYPDCTPEFIGSMGNAIYTGSYYTIRLYTPLQWMMKHEIIQAGDKLQVDWENTWSCYAGGGVHCGTCPTCRARRAGFIKADVKDPTIYASS